MSKYVDGFVIPLKKDQFENYRTMAEKASEVWKEHGALEYLEAIGDDLEVKDMTPFPRMAGCQPDEIVVFSWIVYKSREHRDAVNAKVMADPRIKELCDSGSNLFDCRRMAYGGFKAIVDV